MTASVRQNPFTHCVRHLGAGLLVLSTLLTGCMGGSYGAPKITVQPGDVTAFVTQTATFSFGAEGSAPLTFQWKRNGINIASATNSSYITPVLVLADSGAKFSVTVSNGSGSVTSSEATLTVQGPPAITTQPVPVSVNVGATATFTVTATGDALSYQWLKDDVSISGATSASYTTAATVAGDDGASYSVAVANGAGAVFSAPVLLSVASVPAIVNGPVSQVVAEGESVLFGVQATGGALTYVWKRNGVAVPLATGRRYVLAAAALADDTATYTVTVTNGLGTATSAAATLSVAARAAVALPALPAYVDTARAPQAGESFTVVLKSNGTVWSWGYNGEGQRGNGTAATEATDTPTPVTLPAAAVAVELAVGGHHALVRLQNGEVYVWGRNSAGQLGVGDLLLRSTPVKVTLPHAAIAIAAGLNHSLVVLDDGSICAFGLDDAGQLGIGGRVVKSSPVAITGLSGVAAVAAGNAHSLALLADGSVYAWGANAAGQLGDGTLALKRVPTDTGLRHIVRLRAGADLSMALTTTRMVYAWGENSAGQLGRGAGFTADVVTPTGVALDAVDASASDLHLLLAGTNGTVRGAGGNASGEVGDTTTTARTVYTSATGVTTALSVTAGGRSHSLALAADGQVYAWGNNAAKQLGNSTITATGTSTPTLVPAFDAIP